MSRNWVHVPPILRKSVGQLPQLRMVACVARALTPDRLRILAFHGVPDRRQFARVIDEILRWYTPVSEDHVVQAIAGVSPLPKRPVWFTFDDGLPSTFAASSLLSRFGIRATAFVCPAILDTNDRLWFQTWEDAKALGLLDNAAEEKRFRLSLMKTLPDPERRAATHILTERLVAAGASRFEQATQEMLESWVKDGHFIGNHTWDHPLLDKCSADEQRRQVVKAHDELVNRGFSPRFLAYPNGNVAPASTAAAQNLGYIGSLLFDHRLTSMSQDPHHLSRVRIDSDVSARRAASILSGAHSALLHLAL